MKFQEDKAKASTKGTWCSKSSAKDKEETLKQKKKRKKSTRRLQSIPCNTNSPLLIRQDDAFSPEVTWNIIQQ